MRYAEEKYAEALLEILKTANPFVYKCLTNELENQRKNLKLIASENYCSLAVQAAMGSIFTDKYAEGIPFHRFYAGCENVDALEDYCVSLCKKLFKSDFAYVQPHSGADANLCAYWAILSAKVQAPILEEVGESNISAVSSEVFAKIRRECNNQRLLSLDYYSGGHLTHGYRHNVSAEMFEVCTYGVDRKTSLLDYDEIERKALDFKPLILLAGYSAYPRKIDFERMRSIADKCGAVLMVDMAHFAGLVAGGVFEGRFNPVPYADIVTSTTHKTLRGPRGGIILCKEWLASYVEKGCPLVIGGPLEHVIAAKAIAFEEALRPDFHTYALNVVKNSSALAASFMKHGLKVVSGGTDNHIVLVDVSPLGITGRQAESALRSIGITLNRNALPFDVNGPWYTSGLRFGTAALTTRGMGETEMDKIGEIAAMALKAVVPEKKASSSGKEVFSKSLYRIDDKVLSEQSAAVKSLLADFPLYPQFSF